MKSDPPLLRAVIVNMIERLHRMDWEGCPHTPCRVVRKGEKFAGEIVGEDLVAVFPTPQSNITMPIREFFDRYINDPSVLVDTVQESPATPEQPKALSSFWPGSLASDGEPDSTHRPDR